MIIRQLTDGHVLAISQESHADVAAQFAAHWGGGGFARPARQLRQEGREQDRAQQGRCR